MPIVDYKPFKEYPEVKGIFQGGCVSRGDGSRFRRLAHAHTDGQHQGWICVLGRSRPLLTDSGKPTQLMLHELAHILTGKGHVDEWRAKARELGYRVPRRYWKKKRIAKKIGHATHTTYKYVR